MSEKPTDTCGPCRSGLHERCYEPCLCRDRGHPVETLTPSEVALAKVLAKLVAYTSASPVFGEPGRCHDVLEGAKGALFTDRNRALLERARKAGVL